MIAFFKALPLGIVLTLVVCLFMGSGGATGGMLNIRSFHIQVEQIALDMQLYWSWMLFLAGTGLSWALIFMMGD